ncbi:similar to HGFL protein, isoform CRA_c [Rattus norvegicus]|uniref:Similar to HGFL protein, isoform CRA_c n=1 Tax=Rattus norvegicus TaxID=10116 RepID=A6IKA1_RAT|nr:similar to HGFL protein, isoform CRA_c [Rattus norvegicus]
MSRKCVRGRCNESPCPCLPSPTPPVRSWTKRPSLCTATRLLLMCRRAAPSSLTRLAPPGPEPLQWAGAHIDTGTGQATLLQLGGATFCVVVKTLSHFSFGGNVTPHDTRSSR